IGISLVIATLWQFRVFDIIFVMTGGGPSGATETLAIQLYREAFQYFEMSYAAAVGMVTLALSVISTFFYLRLTSTSFYLCRASFLPRGRTERARKTSQHRSRLPAGQRQSGGPALPHLLDDRHRHPARQRAAVVPAAFLPRRRFVRRVHRRAA